jgi:LuxR family transcriptional regulator, maltose regulon positive regulatory protein
MIMARATPRIQGTILHQPGQTTALIEVGTPAWFTWLEQATTFAFTDAAGSFTARKERSGRSGFYWKAYRMRGGTLHRAYLGKSSELTLARLQAAAQELAERTRAAGTHPNNPELLQHDHAVGSQSTALVATLLAAKLDLPRAPANVIGRAQLVDRLNLGLRGRLTLLSAPAGFGKTTLLATWLSRRLETRDWRLAESSLASSLQPLVPQVAWVALDAEDNDPARFWSYIIGALAGACPSLGAAAVPARIADQASIGAMLTDLLNALGQLTCETLLVLDDYHLIEATAIHQGLALLIERLPRQLHLVIATRSDPPLPLTRLRARGELTELRAPDLRFTLDETAAFLIEQRGLALAADDLAKLHAHTEGWAAGLQLAAVAARGCGNLAAFVAAFNGSNRFVMGYLVDEVLARLPAQLQDFVLRTSILDRMCGALCDTVLGIENEELRIENMAIGHDHSQFSILNSQLFLEELERANLFVVALDDQRMWYRYQHLFVEAAHERLRATTTPADVAMLHTRASAWYEQQSARERRPYLCEAIRHALAARDWERSARLLEQHGLLLATDGLQQTVCGWLETIPDQVIVARPMLCLYHAVILMFLGRLDAAEARLREAERGIGAGTPHDQALGVLAQIVLARANLARCVGDLDRCVALSRQVLLLSAATPTIAHAGALLNLARAYHLSGDAGPAAERLAEEAIVLMRASGNRAGTLASVVNLAQLRVRQGQLRAAAQNYAQAAELKSAHVDGQLLIGGPGYHFGLGELLREQNDLDGAEDQLKRGMEGVCADLIVDADVVALGHQALARLRLARGDGVGARATLESFAQLARQRAFVPRLLRRGAALRAQLALWQGDLAAAVRWADTSGLDCSDGVHYPDELEYLTLARVRIAMGRADPTSGHIAVALELLDRLLVAADAGARVESTIEILLVRALAMQALGNLSSALVSLARALLLAAPAGYIRIFVDEGAPMVELLRAAYARGIAPEYVEQLLAAFGELNIENTELRNRASERDSFQFSILNSQFDSLTTRELEVVRLMAEGASNRMIAERLTLSVGTVKRYANNIFSKLDVQSRTQAIAKARALRLL